MTNRGTFIDLFSGCGGLALGFQQAGFRSTYAVDSDRASCNTYEKNFDHGVFHGDIAKLEKIPRADLVIGGPPCQGFSPLGKMSPNDGRLKEQSQLNGLWKQYLRVVDAAKPRAFVVENVPEFLASGQFVSFRREISKRGFAYVCGILNAADYGVPQKRRRAIIIAVRDGSPELPSAVRTKRTVRDAIFDLPRIPTGRDWHIARKPTLKSLERYRCVPPGGNRFDLMRKRPEITPKCWLEKPTGSTDVFGRLTWEGQALTIRTEFFKPEKGCYLHPEENRPITHREAARLQTFPDDFMFVGSKIETARMIGNAVPPELGRHVANAVWSSMAKINQRSLIPMPVAR